MTLHLHHLAILLFSLLHWSWAAPAAESEAQQGYGYRNRMSAYTYSQPPPVSYSSNQAVYPATYSYPQYQPSYSYSNNYPVYQTYPSKPSYSSWYSSYPSSSYSYSPPTYQHQQPHQYQMSYMLNDLTYPATFSSSSSSSAASSPSSSASSASSSSSSSSSSPVIVSGRQEQSPAWQGKVNGAAHTKCHDGTLLPFRELVKECSGGEDEYDCQWYKKSSIPSIDSFQEFTNVLNQNEKVLVEFFAPWCPACVTFLPILEDIDQTLTYENENLAVYKVNTDENPDLKAMFNVNTFPRVLLFDKSKGVEPRKYEKSFGMKFQPLYNWLKKELND